LDRPLAYAPLLTEFLRRYYREPFLSPADVQNVRIGTGLDIRFLLVEDGLVAEIFVPAQIFTVMAATNDVQAVITIQISDIAVGATHSVV
jgi:hypothetical protein